MFTKFTIKLLCSLLNSKIKFKLLYSILDKYIKLKNKKCNK